MVLLSPKYVLVNQMKTPIEIAQINTQTDSYSKRLNVGDKREWYWQDYNQEDRLIVRKVQPEEVMNTSFSSGGEGSGYNTSDGEFSPNYRRNSSSSDDPESPKFENRKQSNGQPIPNKNVRTFSETDKVTDWEWSRGFSLGV